MDIIKINNGKYALVINTTYLNNKGEKVQATIKKAIGSLAQMQRLLTQHNKKGVKYNVRI